MPEGYKMRFEARHFILRKRTQKYDDKKWEYLTKKIALFMAQKE